MHQINRIVDEAIENERRRKQQIQQDIEEKRRTSTTPVRGGIRFWIKNCVPIDTPIPSDSIDRVLFFSNKIKGNNIIVPEKFPKKYVDFATYIKECYAEGNVDDYIKFISEQITIMIKSSDLDNAVKKKFIALVNNSNEKNEILAFVFIIGLILFCNMIPVFAPLLAAGSIANGMTICITSAVVAFGPSLLISACMESKPYFSTNSKEAREPKAFSSWIKKIDDLISHTENNEIHGATLATPSP